MLCQFVFKIISVRKVRSLMGEDKDIERQKNQSNVVLAKLNAMWIRHDNPTILAIERFWLVRATEEINLRISSSKVWTRLGVWPTVGLTNLVSSFDQWGPGILCDVITWEFSESKQNMNVEKSLLVFSEYCKIKGKLSAVLFIDIFYGHTKHFSICSLAILIQLRREDLLGDGHHLCGCSG